jgi:hypothetical protein
MKGDGSMASEERADADERVGEAFRLDGNAAAGILSEVFVPDLTTARARCANCGAIRALGALHVYAHGMGTVMRCPSCDAVVLRVACPRAHLWLDLSGAKFVVITADASSSRTRKHRRSFFGLWPRRGEARWRPALDWLHGRTLRLRARCDLTSPISRRS